MLLQVAKLLGYTKTRNAISTHVPVKYRTTLDQLVDDINEIAQNEIQNAQPHSVFINESGLYALINNSRFPIARDFREWMYEQVLPAIRLQNWFLCFGSKTQGRIEES